MTRSALLTTAGLGSAELIGTKQNKTAVIIMLCKPAYIILAR